MREEQREVTGWELLRRFLIVLGLLFVAAWITDDDTWSRITANDPSNAAAAAAASAAARTSAASAAIFPAARPLFERR